MAGSLEVIPIQEDGLEVDHTLYMLSQVGDVLPIDLSRQLSNSLENSRPRSQ